MRWIADAAPLWLAAVLLVARLRAPAWRPAAHNRRRGGSPMSITGSNTEHPHEREHPTCDTDHLGGQMVVSSLLPFEVRPRELVLADDREIGFFGEGDMSHPLASDPPAQIMV